jgi:PAS domain S-box-containing protein
VTDRSGSSRQLDQLNADPRVKEYLANRELSSDVGLANEWLRLAMESGKAVGWEWDLKTGRGSWFGDLNTMFGIPSNTYVGRPEDFHRYVHPEDRNLVSDAVADARINHRPYAAEFRVVWPDGTMRWVAATGKFYYSPNGEPERMLGMAVDITDRKQAEDALRETEKRYRRIVETANEGVWLLDSKLHTSYVNRQMAEMLGYEPGEMVGRSVFDSYFPEDVERKKQLLERRQQGVREQFEERLRHRKGSELWVRMAAIPVFKDNGEFDGTLAMVSEITERKRAEDALRESEARLRLAAQVGKMYAYEWDVATDKVVRSEECMSVLGSKDQPKQLTRQQLLASVHPDDRTLFVNSVDQATPDNPTVQISYRVLRPDGSVVWLEKNARAFFDEQGKMLRMIGMVADVTERKKAEEAVLQREKELLEAQRVAQVGSWQWDQKTDAVAWSKELYRIAGRDPALSPPSFKEQSQLYTPESWERLKCAVAEALRTGTPYELDLRMIRPDGSTRWIIDRGEVLRDAAGQIAWLRGTAQDITERKQAEDALRASEEKFRSVFRDAGVGMVIVSPEGRFLAANEAFCDCLGYTEEELLQKTVESVTLAEDWPSFSERLRETLERGTSFRRVEKHCLHKSGRIVITESSASLIRGPSGESRYFVGEVLDITQRKLAEEALSSVSRRLIEAHEEERTRIARELHDDINQRMALLSGNLERVKEILPASDVQARALVDEAGQRVSHLAFDIQSLSHRLHSSNLEYLGLVAACDSFCREVSERQKIEIDFRAGAIPNALPKEISLCLFRVLQEALMNAIKHSEARRFEVGLVNVSNDIELTVHDSGIGFDLEKAMSGQGLGLTSMRERLKLMDGQLSIDSKLQGGTTVHARVPTNARMKTAGASG